MQTPTTNKGWHPRWFYIYSTEVNQLQSWSEPERLLLGFDRMPAERQQEFLRFAGKIPSTPWDPSLLTSDSWLHDHGLLLTRPEGQSSLPPPPSPALFVPDQADVLIPAPEEGASAEAIRLVNVVEEISEEPALNLQKPRRAKKKAVKRPQVQPSTAQIIIDEQAEVPQAESLPTKRDISQLTEEDKLKIVRQKRRRLVKAADKNVPSSSVIIPSPPATAHIATPSVTEPSISEPRLSPPRSTGAPIPSTSDPSYDQPSTSAPRFNPFFDAEVVQNFNTATFWPTDPSLPIPQQYYDCFNFPVDDNRCAELSNSDLLTHSMIHHGRFMALYSRLIKNESSGAGSDSTSALWQ